jgi:hypothetical protein
MCRILRWARPLLFGDAAPAGSFFVVEASRSAALPGVVVFAGEPVVGVGEEVEFVAAFGVEDLGAAGVVAVGPDLHAVADVVGG